MLCENREKEITLTIKSLIIEILLFFISYLLELRCNIEILVILLKKQERREKEYEKD